MNKRELHYSKQKYPFVIDEDEYEAAYVEGYCAAEAFCKSFDFCALCWMCALCVLLGFALGKMWS